MFEVNADIDRNRLVVTLSGFASAETVSQFEVDFKSALERLPRARAPHQLIYDVSSAAIQSQDVVSALRALVRKTPPTSAFALVNGSALAGRQLRRIFAGLDLAIFETLKDATDWLDAQAKTQGV